METRTMHIDILLPLPEEPAAYVDRLAVARGQEPGDIVAEILAPQLGRIVAYITIALEKMKRLEN